jgi:hypothetical protein
MGRYRSRAFWYASLRVRQPGSGAGLGPGAAGGVEPADRSLAGVVVAVMSRAYPSEPVTLALSLFNTTMSSGVRLPPCGRM